MNIALHGKNLNKKKLLVLEAIIENIRSNEINIYTSISWIININELWIYTDGGRLSRPLYIVEDNNDGTHTLTKLNVYKETFQVDSNSLRITKVTNN